MATLTFNAGYEDTININRVGLGCLVLYTNVKVEKIDLIDINREVITKVSDADATQFVCLPGPSNDPYVYRIILNPSNVPKLVARSYTFKEAKVNSQQFPPIYRIPLNAVYHSGPHPNCLNDLAWLLYSVANKSPIPMYGRNSVLPPYANENGGKAAIKLNTRTVGSGEDSQIELYFPADDPRYAIIFDSHLNDTVFATRINGIQWLWEYTEPPYPEIVKILTLGVSVENLQLTFELVN